MQFLQEHIDPGHLVNTAPTILPGSFETLQMALSRSEDVVRFDCKFPINFLSHFSQFGLGQILAQLLPKLIGTTYLV